MPDNPWNTSINPGLAVTALLATVISVMAWAWWPAGYLLP
jgi:hypothetical protein